MFYIPPTQEFILFFVFITVVLMAWHGACVNVGRYRIPVWIMLFVGALGLAWYNEAIRPVAFLWFALLGSIGFAYLMNYYRFVSRLLLIVLGFALAIGALPGFNKVVLLNAVQVSANAVPFTLDLNIAKLGAGLIIFWVVFNTSERQLPTARLLTVLAWPATITIVITLAVSTLSLIDFDPKLSPYFLMFALSNLFFTAMAEEAFFRGLFQKPLQRFGLYPAIIISALLFGLAHFGMGRVDYLIVASIAGAGYAYVYQKTGQLGASMLTHWALNLVHFMTFTYPFLP